MVIGVTAWGAELCRDATFVFPRVNGSQPGVQRMRMAELLQTAYSAQMWGSAGALLRCGGVRAKLHRGSNMQWAARLWDSCPRTKDGGGTGFLPLSCSQRICIITLANNVGVRRAAHDADAEFAIFPLRLNLSVCRVYCVLFSVSTRCNGW